MRREWGNLRSRVLLFLYTWECTAGGKEGNGVQMYCIKHRGLNFNRYITMRSPAALALQTSKPPSTFLTLPATAPPPLLPTHIYLIPRTNIRSLPRHFFFLLSRSVAAFISLYSPHSPSFTGAAGIEPVASFELWLACFKTHLNTHTHTHTHVSNVQP